MVTDKKATSVLLTVAVRAFFVTMVASRGGCPKTTDEATAVQAGPTDVFGGAGGASVGWKSFSNDNIVNSMGHTPDTILRYLRTGWCRRSALIMRGKGVKEKRREE